MKSTGWLWWGFQPQVDRICFQILLMLNIETCAQKEKAKKKTKKKKAGREQQVYFSHNFKMYISGKEETLTTKSF